ncbi:four helix bundle protein [Tenacibaculum aiptasiae]|uniref:Four helix bundle protein n=1 Tax=Tenacibaculum aiptasiae TaxID=426481 RepID=A0A7J5A9I9_9FLAO|nr:four helix bundle protein [Tenacibaculum aiptasiae]KAB1154232.1 four helix bundle protein [Tenacibaculum aiptasiae]
MLKHNFKKLKIWKSSMLLCKIVFKVTDSFPKSELYSLTSQINRSAVSVPSNIAEGSSRSSKKDFKRFLEIALGSLFELQTQIVLSSYKSYINNKELINLEEKIEELQKMISGFKKSLE